MTTRSERARAHERAAEAARDQETTRLNKLADRAAELRALRLGAEGESTIVSPRTKAPRTIKKKGLEKS